MEERIGLRIEKEVKGNGREENKRSRKKGSDPKGRRRGREKEMYIGKIREGMGVKQRRRGKGKGKHGSKGKECLDNCIYK